MSSRQANPTEKRIITRSSEALGSTRSISIAEGGSRRISSRLGKVIADTPKSVDRITNTSASVLKQSNRKSLGSVSVSKASVPSSGGKGKRSPLVVEAKSSSRHSRSKTESSVAYLKMTSTPSKLLKKATVGSAIKRAKSEKSTPAKQIEKMMAKTGNTSLNASKTDAASSRQEEECLQEQILVDDWEAGIDGANAGSSEDEQDSSASGESDDDDDLNMDEDENDENRLPLSAKKDKTPKRPLAGTPTGKELYSGKRQQNKLSQYIVPKTAAAGDDQDQSDQQAEEDSEASDPLVTGLAVETPNPEKIAAKLQPNTPILDRTVKAKRINQQMKRRVDVEADDSEDNETSSGSEMEVEEEEEQFMEEAPLEDAPSSSFRLPALTSVKKVPLKVQTSDHRLQFANFSRGDYLNLLEKAQQINDRHDPMIENTMGLLKGAYSQWHFEIACGFNLLFYGYGSKRDLLNDFVDQYLSQGPTVVINGYSPNLSFRPLLAKMAIMIAGHDGPLGNFASQVKTVVDYMSSPDRRFPYITLLVHNIESPPFANESVLNAMVKLAGSPNIHLVASVDHINSAMLWDTARITEFNFSWHDATSYKPYSAETAFENSLVSKGVAANSDQAAVSARAVLRSVNKQAKDIFSLLAKHQIKECGELGVSGDTICVSTVGLTFESFYSKALASFCASEQTVFRTLLTEFKDHGMILWQRDTEGTDILYIPMTCDLLNELVTEIAVR